MSLQTITLLFRNFLLFSFQGLFLTFLAAAAELLHLDLGYFKRKTLIKWTTHKQSSIHLKENQKQPKIDPRRSSNILGNPESFD
jgi:hypothetical protein